MQPVPVRFLILMADAMLSMISFFEAFFRTFLLFLTAIADAFDHRKSKKFIFHFGPLSHFYYIKPTEFILKMPMQPVPREISNINLDAMLSMILFSKTNGASFSYLSLRFDLSQYYTC